MANEKDRKKKKQKTTTGTYQCSYLPQRTPHYLKARAWSAPITRAGHPVVEGEEDVKVKKRGNGGLETQ